MTNINTKKHTDIHQYIIHTYTLQDGTLTTFSSALYRMLAKHAKHFDCI